MGTLENVVAFADRWHQGQWGLGSLPEALRARVQYADGPPSALGVAYTLHGERWIGLNSWLQEQSLLRRLVIAHEAGHHLLGLTGADYCRTDTTHPKGESIAWCAAATLAVPKQRLLQISMQSVSEDELAAEFEIPVPLARLALRMHLWKTNYDGQITGDFADAVLGLVNWVHVETQNAASTTSLN